MKIVFLSGVKFGLEILNHIIENNFNISHVFSYDESKKFFYSDYVSFENTCKKFGISNTKIKNINDSQNIEILKSIKPDLILVMGWSQLLTDDIISIPKLGVIGSHPTELPKYRGRAPIPWTILKNLKESALTFFYIQKGVDDGDILDQQYFEINEYDDATTLYNKITDLGKKMIIKNLKLIQTNASKRIKQDESKFIEYWKKRTPEDGLIDWTMSSIEIHRLIRATTHPYPGAFTFFNNKKLIIFKARNIDNKISSPGKILFINSDGVHVGTNDGTIILESIQYDDNSNNKNTVFTKNDIGIFFHNLPKGTNIVK